MAARVCQEIINYAGVTGALAELRRLRPGDQLTLKTSHTQQHFTITGVREYSKHALPSTQIFDQQVTGRLALITCGGPFDPSTGNYLDNIVAYALPQTT